MRRLNWLVIVVVAFFTAFAYLPYAPDILTGREIDHFMLASSGIALGIVCGGLMTCSWWSDLHRGYRWWQTTLLVLSWIAATASFLGAAMGITGAMLAPIAPDVYAYHRLLHMIGTAAATFYLVTLVTLWNRFVVAKDTIVILDGQVLYPGTRFRLWPWFWYRVRTVEKRIRVPSTVMNLDLLDGQFAVEVASVAASLIICTGKAAEVASLDYNELVNGVTTWVRGLIREQARSQTLGAFLNHKFDVEAEEIAGFLVIWGGEVEIKLV